MLHIFHYSPTYYLMMEDDVMAVPNYMQKLLEVSFLFERFISCCILAALKAGCNAF